MSLDIEIYMKMPEGYIKCLKHIILNPKVYILSNYKNLSRVNKNLSRVNYKSVQTFKWIGSIKWNEEYKDDPIFSYVFIRKSKSKFVMIMIYVDDLNLVGTLKHISKVSFRWKILTKQNFSSACKMDSRTSKKVVKHFYMDK